MGADFKRIAKILAEEGSIEGAARRLKMSPHRVRLYASILAGQGRLRFMGGGGGCDCSTCPFKAICGLRRKKAS
ncbi:MAG: hypothetical protein F7C35_03595 [Desulfurococcales archaeon]|nr:hypothetical protein [Desulfurococcales archaeon]